MARKSNPFNSLSNGFKKDTNSMTSGFRKIKSVNSGYSDISHPRNDWIKNSMFSPRRYDDEDEEPVEVHHYFHGEPSNNRTYSNSRQGVDDEITNFLIFIGNLIKPLMKPLLMIIGFVFALFLIITVLIKIWELIIYPIILFIISIKYYIILAIYSISLVLTTMYLERKMIIRPYSIIGGIISSSVFVLILMLLLGMV